MSERKVPKLRFAGFTDDWKQRKLGEVFNRIRNAFVGTVTPYYVKKGHFYLESNNIKNGLINRNSQIFINDEFYYSQQDKWLKTGDLVMVQSGHVGHTAVIPPELHNTAAHALIMFSEYKQQTDPYFLNSYFQTIFAKKKIDKITTGNTIKHILASDMKEFVITIPDNLAEQQAIGEFFKQLDDTIAFHQREWEKYKNLKISYLEKMFPQENENKPQLRFPNFTDAWKQRKLGEIGEKFIGGGTPSTNNSDFWNGKIAWIQSSDLTDSSIHNIQIRKKISKKALDNSPAKLINENSIAIVTRVGVGKVALVPFKYATSQDFLSISHLNIDELFASYTISRLMQIESLSTQGTSIKGITKDVLLEKLIFIPPTKAEQQAIGEFFKQLDNTIAFHQRELEKYKNLKNGYLKQMFV